VIEASYFRNCPVARSCSTFYAPPCTFCCCCWYCKASCLCQCYSSRSFVVWNSVAELI